jgi:hypothetical protein
LNIDLKALTKEYESVFEVENRAKRNREELKDAAKIALASFDPVFNRIADRIKECTQIKTHVGSAFDLELYQFKQLAGGVRLISRDARGVRATIGGEIWAAFLQSFVQVEALDNDTIRIVVGHLAEQTIEGRRFAGAGPLWKKETTAPPGSAQLENELQTLQIELFNNLGSAIRAFGECVNKLPKIR